MGPQLKGCGRGLTGFLTGMAGLASMGPQLKGCGRDPKPIVVDRDMIASMGPQLKGCGRTVRNWSAPSVSSFNGAAA